MATNLWDLHPPFQIDGNFGVTSGICEMLLCKEHTQLAGNLIMNEYMPKVIEHYTAENLQAAIREAVEKEEKESGNKAITYTEKTESEKIDISSLQFSELSDYACTGANIKAKVTVKDGSYTLEKGIDYSLTYKNCKNIGTASVTIKGIGKYTGEKTLKYNIVPRKTTLKISKKSDSKVKLTWEKSMGAEKYQIYYSTNGGAYKKLATLLESSNYAVISNLNFKKNDYKFKIRSAVLWQIWSNWSSVSFSWRKRSTSLTGSQRG